MCGMAMTRKRVCQQLCACRFVELGSLVGGCPLCNGLSASSSNLVLAVPLFTNSLCLNFYMQRRKQLYQIHNVRIYEHSHYEYACIYKYILTKGEKKKF